MFVERFSLAWQSWIIRGEKKQERTLDKEQNFPASHKWNFAYFISILWHICNFSKNCWEKIIFHFHTHIEIFAFLQTDKFLKTAEDICGPYVWSIYDLLVLPPSFPFGGMENPCLTFVTPTLLVSIIKVSKHPKQSRRVAERGSQLENRVIRKPRLKF